MMAGRFDHRMRKIDNARHDGASTDAAPKMPLASQKPRGFGSPRHRKDECMIRAIITLAITAAASLPAVRGTAHAELIARYECNIVGTLGQEPIGDRPGHMLVSFQYSCHGIEGLMKGALYTAYVASEWENQKDTYLYGAGIHRMTDGYAVVQLTNGAGSVVMRDETAAISQAKGKVVFKLASGSLASLAGKTVDFTARLTGPGHFIYELMD
jgi:hypothetical protein